MRYGEVLDFVFSAMAIVVALQAITLVRPMLAPVATPREPECKCFFVRHFAQTFAK